MTAADGKVAAYVDYDAWGVMEKEALIKGSNHDVDVIMSYTGHEWDQVLGLYFAQARIYDAEGRRFAARDPVKGSVKEPLTLNAYIYVTDNPVTFTDPTGKFKAGDTLRYGDGMNIGRKTTQIINDVKAAQQALVRRGYLNGSGGGSVDGKYGSFTKKAVETFQTEDAYARLEVGEYGVINSHTWWSLGLPFECFEKLGCSETNPGTGTTTPIYTQPSGAMVERADPFVYYAQSDEQWNTDPYKWLLIGDAGCGPTSMAMVVSTLTGKTILPDEMAQLCYEKKVFHFYDAEGKLVKGSSWGLPADIAPLFNLQSKQVTLSQLPEVFKANPKPYVMAPVGPSYLTSNGHYIVISDYIQIDGENYYVVWDSNYSNNVKKAKEKGHTSVVMDSGVYGKLYVSAEGMKESLMNDGRGRWNNLYAIW